MPITRATVTVEFEIQDGPDNIAQAVAYFSLLGEYFKEVLALPEFRDNFNITRDTIVTTPSEYQPLHAQLLQSAKAAGDKARAAKEAAAPPKDPEYTASDLELLKALKINPEVK